MHRTCAPSIVQLHGASGSVIAGTDFYGTLPMSNRLSPGGLFIVGAYENLGRPIEREIRVNQSRLTGPPAVHQAAVRTARLGHDVWKPFESVFVNMYVGGKFSIRDRALQHQHSHGCLPSPP